MPLDLVFGAAKNGFLLEKVDWTPTRFIVQFRQ